MTTIRDSALELRLRAHGILHPIFTVNAAKEGKCDLASLCAVLMMETGGGRHEFGHDWDFEYAGMEVTEPRYKALRAAIAEGHPSTGVGMVQITSVTLLDEADALGGAWVPYNALEVGAHYLGELQREYGTLGGFVYYNGSGAAAEAYGNRAEEWRTTFDTVIAG